MTTWYSDPSGVSRPIVAFSVRPDLWPPGSYCWTDYRHSGYLADWYREVWACRPDEQHAAPGTAEALILGGHVVHGDSCQLYSAWPEIPDPRGNP